MVDFWRVACWKDHLFQEQHLSRNSAHVVLQLFLWLQDPATLQTKQKCLGNGYFMGKSMVSRVSLPIQSQVAKFTIFTTSLPSCTAYVLIFRFPATLTCGAWGQIGRFFPSTTATTAAAEGPSLLDLQRAESASCLPPFSQGLAASRPPRKAVAMVKSHWNWWNHMDVSWNRATHGYPQIIHLSWIFHCNSSIWGTVPLF